MIQEQVKWPNPMTDDDDDDNGKPPDIYYDDDDGYLHLPYQHKSSFIKFILNNKQKSLNVFSLIQHSYQKQAPSSKTICIQYSTNSADVNSLRWRLASLMNEKA